MPSITVIHGRSFACLFKERRDKRDIAITQRLGVPAATRAVLDPHVACFGSLLEELTENSHHLQNFLVPTFGLLGPLMGVIQFPRLGPLLGFVLVLVCPPRTVVLTPLLVVIVIIVPPLLIISPWAP